ncbi:M48 family metallopeptidase [Williamwhitmania taraxaci]|uniref:M48 family metallopeptidase n=1 Tax=Williamwhitmania taraxaci TaxID=1640674 RepID=UPI0014803573|nr:SprT family zinc-dependent metalloprotease [Williamwhitmania taraxaci]
MDKVFDHPELGPVIIRKRTGLRRLSIRIDIKKRVILTIPYAVATAEGLAFLERKSDWVKKSIITITHKIEKKTIFSPETEFFTKSHRLVLIPESRTRMAVSIDADSLTIRYPESIDILHSEFQDFVRTAVEKTLTLEAKTIIPPLALAISKETNLPFKNISIKKVKSRWGSCSAQNNLNFSIYLMLLPDHLIQYVIIHELCHIKQKNHGPKFWALLDKLTDGKAKLLAKEMKNHSTRYF